MMTSSVMVGAEQLTPFGRGRQSLEQSVWYSGWLLTFLATGDDTEGRFALIEAVTRRGNAPPPHVHHREDEIFYVLEGEMTASVGSHTIRGMPGTLIFMPRDVAHSFETHSEQLRMLILLTPAGLEGCFKECSVPAPAMTLPPQADVPYGDIQRLIAVGQSYGIEGVSSKS